MKAVGRRKAQAKQTVEGPEIIDGLTTDTDMECGDCPPKKSTVTVDAAQSKFMRDDGNLGHDSDLQTDDQQSQQSTDLNLTIQHTARQRVPEKERTSRKDPGQTFLHEMADTMHNIQNTMERLLENTEQNRGVQDRQRSTQTNSRRQVGGWRTPAHWTDRQEAEMTEISSDSDREYRNNTGTRRRTVQSVASTRDRGSGVKLPAFTGKEQWKVWINRFNAIAGRRGWNDAEKLDELLPRLQGAAGDFVFSQLSPGVINNYTELIQELHNRYRVVQTSKTYQAQFSKRSQRQGESVEEYAAELKRLYDMAHGYRDPKTRQEDLLRRFLDGLHDDNARFHVEYVKDPENIDEAVYHVVHFSETRTTCSERKLKKPTRRMSPLKLSELTSESESDSDSSKQAVKRVPHKAKTKKAEVPVSQKDEEKTKPTDRNVTKTEPNIDHTVMQQLQARIKALEDELRMMPQRGQSTRRDAETRRCYNCGGIGHFARNCTQPRSCATSLYKKTDNNGLYGNTYNTGNGMNGLSDSRGDNSRQSRSQEPVNHALN